MVKNVNYYKENKKAGNYITPAIISFGGFALLGANVLYGWIIIFVGLLLCAATYNKINKEENYVYYKSINERIVVTKQEYEGREK